MKRKLNYVFVLWGEGFEEAVAVTFVTELRNVGLCVRMVGLSGKYAPGKYGLTLHTDITLTTALELADGTKCIIIPADSSLLHRAANDPRITELFLRAHTNQAHFVIRGLEALQVPPFHTMTLRASKVTPYITYMESQDLGILACTIAHTLATESPL